MQKQSSKKMLSRLLAFAMVFSFVSQNLVMSVRAAITNPTVDQAISAKVPNPSSDSIWNLSGSDIIGEVDLGEIKADYPHVTFVNLNNTDTTSVVTAAGIISTTTDTFAQGTRTLTYDTIPLAFDKTISADIVLSDILSHIGVSGSTKTLNSLIASGGIDIELYDSTLNSTGIFAPNLSVSDPANTVVFPASAFGSYPAGTTLYAHVEMDYANGGSGVPYTVNIPLNVSAYYLQMTTNMNDPATDPHVYTGDKVEVKVEQFSGSGQHIDITNVSDYQVDLNASTGSPMVSSLFSVSINSDGVLVITFDASDVGSTTGLLTVPSVTVTHIATTSVIWIDYEVADYPTGHTSADLLEYQVGGSAFSTILNAVPMNTIATAQNIYINVSSSISSIVTGNVGTGGAYNATTVYPILLDGAYVPYAMKGMVTFPSIPVGFEAELVLASVVGVDALAVRFSAGNVTTGTLGTILMNLTDGGGDSVDFTFNCQVMPYAPLAYEVYQIPSGFYNSLTPGNELAEMEQAINNNPSQNGITKVSRFIRTTTIPANYTIDSTPGAFVDAEIPQGGSMYLVPVSIASTGASLSIVPSGAVSKWYDNSAAASTFALGQANFVTDANFNGEQVTGLTQVLRVNAVNATNPGNNVVAAVAIPPSGGSTNAVTVDIKCIPSVPEEYFLGVDDGSSTNTYIPIMTAAEVPIGLTSGFTVVARYTNGDILPVPYSTFVSASVTDDNPTSGNPHFSVSGGTGGEIDIKATQNGGYTSSSVDDTLYGEESTITLTDAAGVSSNVKVKLIHPVITGLNYYIVSGSLDTLNNDDTDPASYINTGTLASTAVRQFDYSNPITGSDTSPYANNIDLHKGETVELYVVPVFTNVDRNTIVNNSNYWEYSTEYAQLFIEGVNQSRTYGSFAADMQSIFEDGSVTASGAITPGSGTIITHYAEDKNASNIGDVTELPIATYNAGSLTFNSIQLARDVAVASPINYLTYDPATKTFGVTLTATANFKSTENFVEGIEVEDYTGRSADWYTTYTPISSGAATTAYVGVESSFRAKVLYNNAYELDYTSGRDPSISSSPGASLFADGVFFMQDSAATYTSSTGPARPFGATGMTTVTNEPMDVLRAYFFTQEPSDYTEYINMAPLPPDFTRYDNQQTGAQLDTILQDQMNNIKIKVFEIPASGSWVDVTTDFDVKWSTDYPGIFTLKPDRGGSGTFRVLFYETVTDSITGVTYDVPAMDISTPGSIYTFDLNVQSQADGIALAGYDLTYEADSSLTYDGRYIFEQQLSTGVFFKIYPVIYNTSALGGSATLQQELRGLKKGDIAGTEGLDFMYVADFAAYATELSINNMALPADAGKVIFSLQQEALDSADPTSPDIVYIRAEVLNATGNNDLGLDWTGTLTYTPTISSYDAGSPLLTSASGNAYEPITYSVDPTRLVYDIRLDALQAVRPSGVTNIGTVDVDAAYVNERVILKIQYMMQDGTFRDLSDSELSKLTATSGFAYNELQVTAGSGNPSCNITYNVDSSGSYIYFTPTNTGDYVFEFETANTAGSHVPIVGTKSTAFKSIEQLPGDQTLSYGEIKTISCNFGGGLTPVYTIDSDPNNILDSVALANGILRMTQNQSGVAVVRLSDSSGAFRKTFNVTMTADTGTGVLIPSSPLSMDDGDYVRLREKVTYASGVFEYHDIVSISYVTGDSDFLAYQSNGIVLANGSLAVAGDTGAYTVTSSTGSTHTFVAIYTGNTSTATYPLYMFTPTTITITPGQTTTATIASNIGAVNPDELYLSYSGSVSSIAALQENATPSDIKITGLTPGVVTITAENSRGTISGTLVVTVVGAISFTTQPTAQTATVGSNAAFTALAAGGTGSLSYQWEECLAGGTVWTSISGATATTLTLSSVTAAMNGNKYRCVVTDASSLTAISNEAALTVTGGAGTYNVSGQVTDSATSAPIAGATVTLSGGAGTATTNSTGDYTIIGVANGTYTVTVTAGGYNTGTASVTVASANETGVDVALTSGTSSIHDVSGTVRDITTGTPIAGVAVTLNGGAAGADTTNSNGEYTITGVSDGTYTLDVTASGYDPASTNVTVAGADETVNVSLVPSAALTYYTVSGNVTDNSTGSTLSGVAVSLTDAGGMPIDSDTSDGVGDYTMSNVPDGNYTLTVMEPGYEPYSVIVTVSGSNVTEDVALTPQTSTTPYDIYGQVTDSSTSNPIAGATVTSSDGSSTTTDGNGDFTISGVVDGTYTLGVTMSGYDPEIISVTVAGADVYGADAALNASGSTTYTVSGNVTELATGNPIAGATVTLVGIGTDTSDSIGDYTLSGVPDGSYELTVVAAGYESIVSTVVVLGGNRTVDIVMDAVYTVSGTVTDNATGNPIAGATVTLSGGAGTATTNSTGDYTIIGVANGTYTVTVTASGYSAGSTSVTVLNGNETGVNVTLNTSAAATYTVSGTVSASTGSVIVGATVTLSGGAGSATTDSSGNYSISGVPNGTYTLTASRTGYNSRTANVIVNNANVTHNITLTSSSSGSGDGGGGGGGSSSTTYSAVLKLSPTSISVGKNSTATVTYKQGSASVSIPSSAQITWKINDTSIASMNKSDGESITITGLKAGKTTISVTITKSNRTTYTDTATLTVTGDGTVITPDVVTPVIPTTPTPVTPSGSRFSDVSSDFWGYPGILYLAQEGIVNGYEDGTFKPNNTITRNEFAVMLINSLDLGEATEVQLEKAAAHFADWGSVPDWAKSSWAIAYDRELFQGTENLGVYNTECSRGISRQEVCVVFAKLLGDENAADVSFADSAQIAQWAAVAVQKCAANGLISGYEDNSFKPNNSITRAESAVIFHKYLTK